MSDHSGANAAYTQVPSILREMNNVLALTADLMKPGGRNLPAIREQRLRQAALMDRIALQEAAEYTPGAAAKAIATAWDTAREVARFDAEHGTHAGPIDPGSSECRQDYRAYLRQEYTSWAQHRADN